MDDLHEKLARLNAAVAAKQVERDAAREVEKAKRAALWARIQSEAPEFAVLLGEINRVFGRPAMVRLRVNGERLL